MNQIPFTFPLANGLHARPASQLQELCLRFEAVVVFRNLRNRRRADAGSVLELVASGTVAGDPCRLEVSGPQEKAAGRALRAFLRHELRRADDVFPPPPSASHGAGWLPPFFRGGALRMLPGRALAPGSNRAVAALWRGADSMPKRFASGSRDPREELRLFQAAAREAASEIRKSAEEAGDADAAGILKAHLAILIDPAFRGRIAGRIAREGMPAGAAIKKTAAAFAAVLRGSPSAYLRERAGDLEDIAARLGEKLYGRAAAAPPARGKRILVAAALSPSELLSLSRRSLRGLVLGEVGPTSHTAILARSLAIPAVSLPRAALAGIRAGAELIVDGRRGLVLEKPGPALKRYYRLERESAERRRARPAGRRQRPARTRDGVRVEIAANIGSAAELDAAWREGAEGIGLFRSETLFLERGTPASEEEQVAAYSRAARSAGGRPVIIRTLDVGGDKRLPYLRLPREENPFLGCRAVRFYAEHAELVRCQLRAILRAARGGRLKVMVPMVNDAGEVRLVRRLMAEAAAELRERRTPHARSVELGVMVETPAAALALDLLAREADFFSVGSNDLLQYLLAVDRGNPRLAALYDPRHPAFLRLLRRAAVLAHRSGLWLGLCGEMAGSLELLPLLVGVGFAELSMSPGLIAAVRERLGRLDSGECRSLLRRALRCSDAREVAALLKKFNPRERSAGIIAPELVRLDSTSRTPAEAILELCGLLELGGRVERAADLENAVWKREETFATDLGFGFALPHAKSPAVSAAAVAFLRPARAIRWTAKGKSRVRGVLLIAIPENLPGEEHLRLIARLSRRLMHEDFRAALLNARSAAAVLEALDACLRVE